MSAQASNTHTTQLHHPGGARDKVSDNNGQQQDEGVGPRDVQHEHPPPSHARIRSAATSEQLQLVDTLSPVSEIGTTGVSSFVARVPGDILSPSLTLTTPTHYDTLGHFDSQLASNAQTIIQHQPLIPIPRSEGNSPVQTFVNVSRIGLAHLGESISTALNALQGD